MVRLQLKSHQENNGSGALALLEQFQRAQHDSVSINQRSGSEKSIKNRHWKLPRNRLGNLQSVLERCVSAYYE